MQISRVPAFAAEFYCTERGIATQDNCKIASENATISTSENDESDKNTKGNVHWCLIPDEKSYKPDLGVRPLMMATVDLTTPRVYKNVETRVQPDDITGEGADDYLAKTLVEMHDAAISDKSGKNTITL